MPTELPQANRPLPDSPEPPDSSDHEPRPRGTEPPQREDGLSLRIATVAGIPIRLHLTFLLLLAWLTFASVGRGSDSPGLRLLYVSALFGCVLLHELGHALVAQRYGIRTRDIVLYPIGGIASLENLPRPRQELWIALAGPVVNVIIAGLLYAAIRIGNLPMLPYQIGSTPQNLLTNLMWTNLVLAGFNMLPAFPMDGGRVLRALLARVMDDVHATTVAARIGQGMALLFGFWALFSGQWLLLFIAAFVYMGAGQEATVFQAKALMEGHRVREAMLREFHTLTVGNTLRDAAEALLAGSQQDFPIVHGSEVVGVLSRSALMRGMATEGPEAYVAGVMEREFAWTSPDAELETLMTPTLSAGPILVMNGTTRDSATLVGMVTQENLLEFLMLTQLQARPRPH